MVNNITFVTSYFAPAWSYGGPPRVLNTLAKELVKQGKTVKVITTDVLDERRNTILKEKLEGIEVYRFKTVSNTLAFKFKIFIAPGVLEGTRDILDKSDIVLFSDIRSIINWQLYPYVLKKKIPYGIFAFGTIPCGFGFKSIVKKIFDKLWVVHFVQNASFRFAQTKHEQEMYYKFFGISLPETQLLPLPVEEEEQKIDKCLLNSFKKKWDIKENDKVLLFVGRLHYLKGVDILIEAVTPLLKRDKNLKLLIVGRDDGEEKELKTLVTAEIADQVIFTGPLYGEDVVYAYKTATCFVMTPRFYEETSLAALEALNYGIPVVTTKESDIPYLEKYDAGFVIENTSGTIQRAIYTLLEKVRIGKVRIQNQTIKLINDYYRLEIVAQQLLDYLKQRRSK